LLGGAGLRHRLAVQESDFRQFTAHGDLGLEWRIDGDDTLRVGASAQRFDVGGERNRELAGATLQWQRAVNRRTQVTAFGQYAALRFPEQQLRDVNRYTIGLGFGHAVAGRGNPVLFASVYGGFEDATRVAANQVSRTLVGTRLGGELALTTRWSAYGILNYQYSDYDGREPLFGRARREHYVDLAGGLRYRIQDGWSLTPQLLWAHNDANLPLFEYDRWEATLTLRNDF
jgi:outer membrane protein